TFPKRCQAPHVIRYDAALQELVVTCEFGACADEMIRDQLMENVLSPRIRERLLLETDVMLDIAVTVVSQIESAADQVKSISNPRQAIAPVQAPVPLPDGPWQKVAMDIVGPFDTATSDCSHHGNPLSIVTDNGIQFTSAAFAAFLEQRNIRNHHSSLYYPVANGAVERFNRVLKHTIQMAIQQHQPWKPVVTDFL
ncbi:hypothetical protein QTP70_025423, partial [Hemibagrus guttatus]